MQPLNVLIVGASGGIGSALSQHILTHTNANVFATYRRAQLECSTRDCAGML